MNERIPKKPDTEEAEQVISPQAARAGKITGVWRILVISILLAIAAGTLLAIYYNR